MQDSDIRCHLLLSVQRALLGAVSAGLRAVTCNWSGMQIRLQFIFDGEVAEDDREGAQIVGTEVIADFSDGWTIKEEIVRLDSPASLSDVAYPLWAYRRKESNNEAQPIAGASRG